jgi:uncharacterized protein (TIGR00661 family)
MGDHVRKAMDTLKAESKVLFGVLNWGLGHATRSSVVIQALVNAGHDVHIASDGEAGQFLQKTFPGLNYHPLPAYDVQYQYDSMFWNMLLQGTKIFSAIAAEHKRTKALYHQHQYDVIISDNRYGLHLKACDSIIITHQLQVLSHPKWTQVINRTILQQWLRQFDKIWVPDFSDQSLSGKLSQRRDDKWKVSYIGPLSLLHSFSNSAEQKNIDILCLLSGPEPQRSKLERLLVEQLEAHAATNSVRVVLIRGKINAKRTLLSEKIKVIDFCSGQELATYLASATLVICRSGYSTIMDLEVFNKKAILIPTPGQPEQEYLAQYLSRINKKYETLSQRELKEKLLERLKMEG